MADAVFTLSLIANPILAFFAGAYFSKWMRQRRSSVVTYTVKRGGR